EVKHVCNWILYDRTARFALSASFKVENAKTGDAMGAGQTSKESVDKKYYLTVSGDEKALPSEFENYPRTAVEPNQAQLSQSCANAAGDDLGLELFKAFK